jgi:hypothetical protein
MNSFVMVGCLLTDITLFSACLKSACNPLFVSRKAAKNQCFSFATRLREAKVAAGVL